MNFTMEQLLEVVNAAGFKSQEHLANVFRSAARLNEPAKSNTAKETFTRVYRSGLWGRGEVSGAGSASRQAAPYIEAVNALIRKHGWQAVVDLGCGDGQIATRLMAPRYIGVDCYTPHLGRLRSRYPEREWLELDLDTEREHLPVGDVALLKDVLHHWPTVLVRDWLRWALACGKWQALLCTQDRGQHASDCALGGYRGLAMENAPLSEFPFVKVQDYLHKSILALQISPSALAAAG